MCQLPGNQRVFSGNDFWHVKKYTTVTAISRFSQPLNRKHCFPIGMVNDFWKFSNCSKKISRLIAITLMFDFLKTYAPETFIFHFS